MIRSLVILLIAAALLAVPAAAGVTEFDADYLPTGPVIAGQEMTVYKEIFVGERFSPIYTLEFDTELSDPVWKIDLVVSGRVTQTWDFPYEHGTISGFTISTDDNDTKLTTTLTGTPASYDVGQEIILWQMKVMMANGATKDTFVSTPVTVESKPAPTAATLPVTTVRTVETLPPHTFFTTVPTTVVTTVATEVPTTVPTTPPTTPASSFYFGAGLIAALSLLLLWRR
ncbi:hypothetical protein [Methanorbis rubei]|uniref:Uncharacterized protein n=1 Tax=Methanorbis rubei TaxID=3028300 RepID=A0AAE4MEY2_9EURY|nr:hypothetical protein [Methanocorpusculaceae archaeon Cs1]